VSITLFPALPLLAANPGDATARDLSGIKESLGGKWQGIRRSETIMEEWNAEKRKERKERKGGL